LSTGAGPLDPIEDDELLRTLLRRLGKSGGGRNYLCGETITSVMSGAPSRGILVACAGGVSESADVLRPWPSITLRNNPDVVVFFPGSDRNVVLVGMDGDIERFVKSYGFAVTAMAVDVSEQGTLIDPMGGSNDLVCGVLRHTAASDGLNALRAVELCASYSLEPDDEAVAALQSAAALLVDAPARRLRAGLARVLSTGGLSRSARMMRELFVMDAVLPEVAATYEVPQNYYHHLGVWEHTLEVLDRLEEIMASPKQFLGPTVRGLDEHFARPVESGVPRRSFLAFAALIHDCGKVVTMKVEDSGRIRFGGHQAAGAQLADRIARRLGLSYRGRRYLTGVVGQHMRLGYLLKEGETTGSRLGVARELGSSSVDIAILSLADRLATRGEASTAEGLERYERLVKRFLADYCWNRDCPTLAGGRDVQVHAGLEGPAVGEKLFDLRLAQKERTVTGRQQALEFIAPDFKGRLSD
jgi:poly(A) polymerase